MSAARRAWLGLASLTVATYAAIWHWPGILALLGIRSPQGNWFVDTAALLASSDGFARGRMDMPLWYSDWWLWLHDLGLSQADAGWLGAGVVLLFLATALLFLRPQGPHEMLLHWLVLCSPVMLLGANRANMDLLIFAALALVGWLLIRPGRAWRLLAPPVIAILTGLKFYPLVAAAALPFGPPSRREKWLLIGLMAGFAVLLGLGLYDDVLRVRVLITDLNMRLYTFGATAGLEAWLTGSRATLVVAGAGLVLLGACWRWAPAPPGGLDPLATVWFVLGTATMTGCFFAGLSFNYRLVFTVLQLPLLGALRRQTASPGMRQLAGLALVGLLALLWIDGLTCLLLSRRPGWLTFGTIVECRQVAYTVVSWCWIGVVTGLWVALARPVCRQLFGVVPNENN